MRRRMRDSRRTRWRAEDGVSLVEVMVAVVLLATAFIALAQVATNGLFSLRSAADRTTAIGLATQSVEAVRALPWEGLSLTPADHTPGVCGDLVDIDQAGTVEEIALCLPGGQVTDDLPYWGPTGPYELETYVTTIPGFGNARRATAVVTWTDRGDIREVRTSTVIAQVERGN